MSYGGIAFDCGSGVVVSEDAVVGILLSLFFHVTNKLIFNIGIFP